MAKQNTSHIDDPVALGQRLRTARLERKLTQSALVFDGCTIGHVSRIEAGLRTPSLQVVRRLAAILGVDEQWLATGTPHLPEPADETAIRAARISIRLGFLDEASEHLAAAEVAVADDAARARIDAMRGELALLDGRAHDAVVALRGAVEADPELPDADAAEALGRAYVRLGRIPEALAHYRDRVRLADEQEDPTAGLRFGVLLAGAELEAGESERAAETLRRAEAAAAQTDPSILARHAWERARAHTMAGDTDGAVVLARHTMTLLDIAAVQQQRRQLRDLVGAGS
jgi:transcriptional regulator with XRE-family HTH domain